MRLLYVGADSVKEIASAVNRKHPAFEIVSVTSLRELNYALTRGEVFDRALVFDTFCNTSFCGKEGLTARQQIQSTIAEITTRSESCLEIVCIAQTPLTTQYFVEELYAFSYNSAVFRVDSQLLLSQIINYTIKSIAELRKTSIQKAQQDIYQDNDDVIWSTKKIVTSTWTQLGSDTLTVKLNDKFRLSIALEKLAFWIPSATWEFKEDYEELLNKQNAPKQATVAPINPSHKLTFKERIALRKEQKQRMKELKKQQKQQMLEEKARLKSMR